jgi:Na+/phosphate symporter
MNVYLTEFAYQRWLRQQLASLSIHKYVLDELRARLNSFSYCVELEEVSQKIDALVENVEALSPRTFSLEEKPLRGFEKLLENMKMLVNLIFRVRGKGDRYLGIYHEEKTRILELQRQYNFNHQLVAIQESIALLEARDSKSICN